MRNNTVAFILCFALCQLTACSGDPEPTGTPMTQASAEPGTADDNLITISNEQFAMAEMETGRMSKAVFPYTIQVNGAIDVPPRSRASVSAYYGGYVQGLDLLPGQRVGKGQLLFRLKNPDFLQMQQDYLETIAQLDYLKSDFERQKTLAAENIASQKSYLKAESDYAVQQARSEGLKKKLELIGIDLEKVLARDFVSTVGVYAPISGTITDVNISSGGFLNAADVALEITSADHLHLELDVFEKDVHLLNKGQRITFRVPGSGSTSYAAAVHLIGGIVEGESRVVRVHGHLEDETIQRGLIPGMYVEASIETAADSVMAVPETAVVNIEEEAFILVQIEKSADAYQFERRLVKVGQTINGMTEIRDKLTPDELVLTKGAFNLIME